MAYAREEASRAGLDNVEFVIADLSNFDETAEPEVFDSRSNSSRFIEEPELSSEVLDGIL